ncbi:MAG: hypothetical protein ACYTFA_13410 [Planctomycetota bacterium]
MRIKTMQPPSNECDQLMALDWSSLGRLVRRRTLDAVTLHFSALAAVAGQPEPETPANDGLDRRRR